jgi:hypothetical protein
MDQLSEPEERGLADELVAAVRRFAPGWSASPDADPGITLLELLAWLTDLLQFRQTISSARHRDLLASLVDKLTLLGSDLPCANTGLARPRYFTGELLTAADFQAEQDYVREKMRRHNRCLFGSGVVAGLGVTVDPDLAERDEPTVTVSPGCAIDPYGEELIVCEKLKGKCQARIGALYVALCSVDIPLDPVPGVSESPEYSRIEERVAIRFHEHMSNAGVTIARIECIAGKWLLDTQFRPAKSRLAS